MKKFLSLGLALAMTLALPSFAMAAKNKNKGESGKVTAVTDTTITITKKKTGESETITVPENTPITTADGSPAPKLSELVGKKVKVSESAPGTASSIAVKAKKAKKAA